MDAKYVMVWIGFVRLAVLASCLVLSACNADPIPTVACAADASMTCRCSDGRAGTQACNRLRSGYGPCECGELADGGADSSSDVDADTHEPWLEDGGIDVGLGVDADAMVDPGLWTGLWIPPDTHDVIVADEAGLRGDAVIQYLPGCLNQGVAVHLYDPYDCAVQSSYTSTVYGTGTTASVILGNGQVMSIRFMSGSDAASNVGVWSLVGAAGGNLGFVTSMWLTTVPGAALSSVAANCQSTDGSSIRIATGPSYCSVTNDTLYYVNISVPGSCTTCGVKLTKNSRFR